jgi:hypothetical protein
MPRSISAAALSLILAWPGAGDGLTPQEVIRRAVEANERNMKLARNYTFVVREVERELDDQGRIRKTTSETWDVTLLKGSPYQRLIARDDQPLSPKEARKEEERLAKSIAERQKEGPKEEAKRLREQEERRQRTSRLLAEINEAFDFRFLPEESAGGRTMYVIEGTPRPKFKARSREGKILSKLHGRLWIDKDELQWVKADIDVVDTIAIFGFLARIHKGTHMSFEATRVNDEVWLPKRVYLRGTGRLALLKKLNAEVENTFRDYRKFTVETKITTSEIPHD